jgi:hypothetical protein
MPQRHKDLNLDAPFDVLPTRAFLGQRERGGLEGRCKVGVPS